MEPPNSLIRKPLISLFFRSVPSSWLILLLSLIEKILYPDQLSILNEKLKINRKKNKSLFVLDGVVADVLGVEAGLFYFQINLCVIALFMATKICCKCFRRGAEVCNLCLEFILKVTKAFLSIFCSWFLANSEFFTFPVFSDWPQSTHFRLSGCRLWDAFRHGFKKDPERTKEARIKLILFLCFAFRWYSLQIST